MLKSRQSTFLALLCVAATATVEAFSVSRTFHRDAVAATANGMMQHGRASTVPSSTCLWAEEQKEETEEGSSEETIEAGEPQDAAGNDILNSPAFLQRKLEVLESDIEKIEAEIAQAEETLEAGKQEWEGQIEALEREYDNIRERMSNQTMQGDAIATAAVVEELLELLDNFDRAFGVVKPETDAEKAIDAEYRKLYDDIIATFNKLGVTQVETVGTEFNYEFHQAIMQRASDEYEEGTVVEEYQKGFVMGEKLIRPAMVAVAA